MDKGCVRERRIIDTVSVMMIGETRKCADTIHGFSPVSTLTPPITACSGTPSAAAVASRRRSLRLGRYRITASQVPIATTATTNPSIRLPNSIAPWIPSCGCGTYD